MPSLLVETSAIVTQPSDHVRHGFEVVRDHRAIERPAMRNVTGAARILDDGADYRLADAGDKINWAHWATRTFRAAISDAELHTDRESRSIGGWSMAWPAEIHESGLLPRYDGEKLDARFAPLSPAGDADANAGENLFRVISGRRVPAGTAGVMVAGTREQSQENLFVPAYEIVAQHAGEDAPEFSTPVFDLQPGTKRLDERHGAGLHAHLRVAQLPDGSSLKFAGEWVPAWNATKSAADATGFGAFLAAAEGGGLFAIQPMQGFSPAMDVKQVAAGSPTPMPVGAFAGWEAFGPLHPGHVADKHRIGEAPETGMPWNSGHIWTNAYFYRSIEKDGPLHFEDGPFVPGGDLPIPTAVHLCFDASVTHPWLDGPRDGMWRWWTTSPLRRPFPPPMKVPPFVPDDPPAFPPIEPPVENVPLNPRRGEPVDPARSPWELALPSLYGSAIRRFGTGDEGMPYDGRFGGPPVDGGPSRGDVATGLFPGTDSPSPETAPVGASGPIPGRFTREWVKAPLVWHMQSFGASDARGDWVGNTQAGDFYLSPTTDGGVWFTPPEVLLDAESFYPDAVSVTTLALYPGHGTNGLSAAIFGWGVPDLDTGALVDGPIFSATGDPNAHDLTLDFLDDAGNSRAGSFTMAGAFTVRGVATAVDSRLAYDPATERVKLFDAGSTEVVTLDGFNRCIDIAGTAVLGTRKTGWTAASGTATRTGFATGSVTLATLAEHVKALIDDLIAHGIIGA